MRTTRSGGRSGRRLRALAATVALVAAGVTATAAPAVADDEVHGTALAGHWAPFDRCPVDDPAMLAADGADVAALCLASSSQSGTMKIGEKVVPTAGTNLQFGLLGDGTDYTSVSPEGAGIQAEPVTVPGGLLNLMCPSEIPVLTDLCEKAADSKLNRVVATVEPAGTPTDFSLTAGLGVGQPIVTLPVKIRLDNVLLGSKCYIGSNSDPILLRPRNLTQPALTIARYAPDGTDQAGGPMSNVVLSGADQGDDSFTVPKANGCGLLGALDWAVNLQLGLPSPEGANSLVLNAADTATGGFYTPAAFAPDQGRLLAEYWHAAQQ
ncbi:hypothetical protein [Saccharomonospora sp. NB11]|jgi:hypothetical protein|uniref:hypothetical protein n=1 Tax=Saccharomonospora sp. NB11 TaxID=1642298 RepID=UPI0018D1CFD8|nr:hypothetical protein [Saccharomonospora sp. NB11]